MTERDATNLDWSPADSPHAIAVSQAQWWLWTVQLTASRLADGDDHRLHPVSSRQIDARLLVLALAQMLRAEKLVQEAGKAFNASSTTTDHLRAARTAFLTDVPGLSDTRDALTHFDEWARGVGRGPQLVRRKDGDDPRIIAREAWPFGYDPRTQLITAGSNHIHVPTAERAASKLAAAIYHAARLIDSPGGNDLSIAEE